MSENFHRLSAAVNRRLTELSKHELFVVDGIDLFTSYLLSFPEGTNPVFRTNTEHDCSCCKSFIRNMGGVVAIVDGKKTSIWRAEGLPHPYDTVAAAMDQLVLQLPIKGVFRTKEHRYGADHTYDSERHRWYHLHGTVERRHRSASPAEDRGHLNTTAQVLERGLKELSPSAVETVLDLIDSNGLYRGAEFKRSVQEFASLQREYRKAANPELHVWSNINSPAARFRNTVIGTLVQDLSDGVDMEQAVRSFESKVAPTNYKRPTALITPKMIDAALKTLDDLGLEHAVERRFARLADVSVNDVLWVDNSVRERMRDGSLRGLLMESATARVAETKGTTPISIDDFVGKVLPSAQGIEVLVENRHEGNFASLTAPVHASTGRLFRWNNDFAWSYVGEVADSIKQKVKRAGGNTNAALRVSLAWSNHDDLDLHAHCPDGHVYYGDKKGILDVDMNAVRGHTREPVENLSWIKPRDGTYQIIVHQFAKREATDVGFTLEIECNGEVKRFNHGKAVADRREVKCISFRMAKGVLQDLKVTSTDLVGGDMSMLRWGVKTQTLVPASTIMASPNHWENAGGVGNKHWFFILKDCKNPEPIRGIYNEFLRGDLEPHRKVFEVLGSRTKCQPTDDQLSGLGFSAARNDTVTAKVTTDRSARTYTINF